MKLKSVNPTTGKVVGTVDISTVSEIESKIRLAHKAKDNWAALGVKNRVKILKKVLEGISSKKEELAQTASKEMGMPINFTRADVGDACNYFGWYLDNAERYLAPEVTYSDKKIINTVYREPIGVGANITPWNFPVSNFVWSVPQSLVAGNVSIYKTSEEVPLCGQIIEEIMDGAGLPTGVFSEIYGDGEVGKNLVNGDIDLICFTGSTKVGKYLYKVASEKFIKVFLELGGSAAGIVCKDIDVDNVLESIFGNRFYYSGQVCDGLKRLIVHKSKFDEVIIKLNERIQRTVVGDPLDEKTEIGPLVSEHQLEVLDIQVKDALKKGAKIVAGGERIKELSGAFYKPTILINIKNNMKVWNEEVFGPVLPIKSFDSTEEAVELANDTQYGLGSYIFGKNDKTNLEIASKLKTGMVAVNNSSYVKPQSPFGGYKNSGIGREHGKYGFHDLTQVKVVAEEK